MNNYQQSMPRTQLLQGACVVTSTGKVAVQFAMGLTHFMASSLSCMSRWIVWK